MNDNISFDEEDERITLGGGLNIKKILIIVVPLVVVIAAVYIFVLRDGGDKESNDNIPVAAQTLPVDTVQQAPVKQESVEVATPPEETAPVRELAAEDTKEPVISAPEVKETTTDLTPYKFHVIVGAFGVESNAVDLCNKLKAEGLNSKIHSIRDGTMTAVSYNSLKTKEEAVVELRKVQRDYDKNAWILEKEIPAGRDELNLDPK